MRIPFCRPVAAFPVASFPVFMALVACTSAAAQPTDLSARKLTMIVGFAPGGGVDTLARVVAQEMDQGGYQVVIENRPGAGSKIAAKAVAGAAPDGAD